MFFVTPIKRLLSDFSYVKSIFEKTGQSQEFVSLMYGLYETHERGREFLHLAAKDEVSTGIFSENIY
jgi:hypothetical protein